MTIPTRPSFPALALIIAILPITTSCGGATGRPASPAASRGALDRLRFNQLAMRLDLPLFWEADADADGAPDPGEVRTLLFHASATRWTEGDRFTPAFEQALARIRAEHEAPEPTDPRLRWVVAELDHAAPTLVSNDLRDLPPEHRGFARHMVEVASMIDRLYALQTGTTALRDRVPAGEPASQSLFRRNWGPRCLGAITEGEPGCSAIPGAPRQIVDVYPAAIQEAEGFCATLEARPDAAQLIAPFTVVRERDGALVAVPYSEAYADLMRPIAAELRAAADAMTDPSETALVTYLRAAASAFESNDWEPADEAWSRMSMRNSRWYVRVGPDETYWDPCSQKAGFHTTFARINQGSLAWQDRLQPIQGDMERALASLASDVYTAREVAFHMPDFIDIVVNAGDDRDAFGATIGQSLPNWGPVSEEGRGRTVAMSNLYTDEDSNARRRAQASSMLTADAVALFAADPEVGLLSTILHEATHNLGPSHEYRVEGRTDSEAFGGGLASMLEELKAQSGALFYVEWLRERGVLTDHQAKQTYVDSIVWAFGHVSRGMYTPSGQRKAYSQLAAVQLGFLMDDGALRWDPEAIAADGASRGAYTIDFARLPAACRALMERVMRIKATGDRAAAEALAARYVDGDIVPQSTIVERYRRFPQATFVYALEI
jgi:hypothetical protein